MTQGPSSMPFFDLREGGADTLGYLTLHRLDRRWVVRPARAAHPVRMRHVDCRAQIAVERLHHGEGERVVERRQFRLRKALREIGEDRGCFCQYAVVGNQSRHPSLKI